MIAVVDKLAPAAREATSGVEVCFPRKGVLRLSGVDLFAQPASRACRGFLNRVFPLDFVVKVILDPAGPVAEIHFDDATPTAAVRQQLVAALRRPPGASIRAADYLCLPQDRQGRVCVTRHGHVLSTWEVVHELPGRLRVRHDALRRRPEVARRLQHELELIQGIDSVAANSSTATVLILYDGDRLSRSHLLHVLERSLVDCQQPERSRYVHEPASRALCHANLGLAAAGDFALPMLVPASATLLVLLNLKNIRNAAGELAGLRPGLATLYTTIVGFTLATGAIFPAALMHWLMHFWDRRFHADLETAQRELLAPVGGTIRFAWRCHEGSEIETPIEQIRAVDILAVHCGETIPADGVVASGEADVDERLVQGASELSRKRAGDRVYANTRVLTGDLHVRVERTGQTTRAATIAAVLTEATTPEVCHLKVRGEPFARKAVAPTLATAAAGLAVGDASTALAVLRTDYATGAGMGDALGAVENAHRALQAGIVLRNPAAADELARVDFLLIDHCQDSPLTDLLAGHRGGAEDSRATWARFLRDFREFRKQHAIQVGLVSDFPHAEVRRVAEQLGLDLARGSLGPEARGDFVRESLARHTRVAYVGDTQRACWNGARPHVAISLGDIARQRLDAADAFLLQPKLTGALQLWDLADRHSRRRWSHGAWTLLPNLCCVAGVFAFGFTSLHTIAASNLASLTVYRGSSRWLRDTIRGPPLFNDLADDTHTACGGHAEKRRIAWNTPWY